ncbi:NAD-dependent epimerase/dehydratase family protein [Salisaeta longa]|uniref:NAD-dependent epimerase/dehydratase family protein n=1 Tax=Salisaeta longa TaxID=503170 RepID=UPI0003B519C1|nr:NAD-dependent epimerase/dehydratase family protein [Salisaeta longa]
MRYLITGGAGFIGSHLADALLADGHSVHAFDNLSTGRRTNIEHLASNDRFALTIGNVLDAHTLEQIMRPCDAVIHLAAAVGVKRIMEHPVETIQTNVGGTENVLQLAHHLDKKVLLASTSEVYGKAMQKDPSLNDLSEGDDWTLGTPEKRRWAYACSKAMDEFLARAYYDEYDVPVVCMRFFNTVGPRQSSQYGMVIPTFVRQALAGGPVRVFGDGTQSRCFTHVRDAVAAVRALLDAPAAEGEIFNIGNHEEVTINDLAARVIARTGSSAAIDHIPYEEVYGPGFEDMKRRTPNLDKIRSVVGYAPQHTTEDILDDVIAYEKQRPRPAPAAS